MNQITQLMSVVWLFDGSGVAGKVMERVFEYDLRNDKLRFRALALRQSE